MTKDRLTVRRLMQIAASLVSLLLTCTVWSAPPPGVLDETHAGVRAVMAVQGEVTSDLMKLEGILGTAVGLDDNDQLALVVYVDRDSAKMADLVRGLPPQIRGTGIKVELTDKFRAMGPGKPGGGVSHTAKQTPPIQLGTSGGWGGPLTYKAPYYYCCGGTLGSLIQVNGEQYILSNFHVFEGDIENGSNGTTAKTGDSIVQPGLIDLNCDVLKAQAVGKLVKLSSLPDNNVDCSVAQVIPDMVKADGSILEIGTISSQTVGASLKQAVQKSGRTTGLASSTVSGINGTISVAYDNECAGVQAFVKTFTKQIIVANRGSKFLAAGDSGSLMVEKVSPNPRAVGLLYAGSSVDAIANPISEVLAFIGPAVGGTGAVATMVGK